MSRRLTALPALALVLTGAGCATVEPAATSSPTSSPISASPSSSASAIPTVSTTPSPSTSPSATPAEQQADVTVAVTIKDGKVRPNAESVDVELGQTVLITAVSDVEDSVHVHGYDHTLTLSPDKPAEVEFTADEPGVFEVETHETHKLAAKLIVS